MPKREQRRSREEQHATEAHPAEQKEASLVDGAFRSSVKGYFDARKEETMDLIKKEPGEAAWRDSYEFLEDQRDTLSRLANPKLLEKMQPKDVSLALSELASTMEFNNPNAPGNGENIPIENRPQKEKRYIDTRKVFMDCCGKMFPDAGKDIKPENLYSIAANFKRLTSLSEKELGPLISELPNTGSIEGRGIATLKRNPKETIMQIDAVCGKVAIEMKSLEIGGRYGDTMVEQASAKAKLVSAVETMHKMQLIRDRLMKQAYGRADMTPSEARKIDEALKAAGGKKPEVFKKAEQEIRQQGPVAPAPKRREAGRTESREADSEQREKELIAKVLEESGVLVHSAFDSAVSEKGLSGFQDLKTSYKGEVSGAFNWVGDLNSIENQLGPNNREPLDKHLEKHNIREFIDIRQAKTPQYQTIAEGSIKKGFWGFGREPRKTEQKYIGSRQMLHSEIIKGGIKEPAISFVYRIRPTSGEWQCNDGRRGQILLAKFVLPESTARQIAQAIDRDPAIVRKITEAAMRQIIPAKEIEKTQGKDNSILPRYKEWDAMPNGGRVYVQKGEDAPGWHEECVHQVKK